MKKKERIPDHDKQTSSKRIRGKIILALTLSTKFRISWKRNKMISEDKKVLRIKISRTSI